MKRALDFVASTQFVVYSLCLSIVVVVIGTLAQANAGIYAVQQEYFYSFFLYWTPGGEGGMKIPVFPGGALIGLAVLASLTLNYAMNLELRIKKSPGSVLTHLGLIVLIVGEFIASFLSVHSRLGLVEGETGNAASRLDTTEIAIVDESHPDYTEVFAVPQAVFEDAEVVTDSKLPFTLKMHWVMPNSELRSRKDTDPPNPVNRGVGLTVTADELPLSDSDANYNNVTAVVDVMDGETKLGTWLLSNGLGAPQAFQHGGKSWRIGLRNLEVPLPFTVTLKDFSHDKYPGTNIPRNFSSLVELQDSRRNENRDVLIYMNHPLRYDGYTFYQSSFGRNDTLSIFEVVQNPGRLLPYIACTIVSLGMCLHFIRRLMFTARREK